MEKRYDVGQDINPSNMDDEQLKAWNELSREEKVELLKAQQQAKQEFYKMADDQIKPFEKLRKGWKPMESPYQKGDPESVATQQSMPGAHLKPEYQELAKSFDPAIAYLTQKINDNRMNSPVAKLWAEAGQTLAKQESNYNEFMEMMPDMDPEQFGFTIPGQIAAGQQNQPVQQQGNAQQVPQEPKQMIRDRDNNYVPMDGGVSDEQATDIFRRLMGGR